MVVFILQNDKCHVRKMKGKVYLQGKVSKCYFAA